MEEEMRQSARSTLSFLGGLVLLGGTSLGMLFFSLLALITYAYGRYEFTLIGTAGVGGLVYGVYSFFHPPRVG
jgi:hypothetical protein